MTAGILQKGIALPAEIVCTSAEDGTGPALAARTGITCTTDADEILQETSILILAIKPQQFRDLSVRFCAQVCGHLVISILAGTPLSALSGRFPAARNIVRAMPNTPGQIGAGITAFATAHPLEAKDEEVTRQILGAMGPVHRVEESDLDAVTALSGSGPAYVFEFIAALREGGIEAGLNPAIASQLALETVLGSALLLKQSGTSPEHLRDQVTSPGGTTLAGLTVLQQAGFRQMIADTVLAAQRRSRELAALAR